MRKTDKLVWLELLTQPSTSMSTSMSTTGFPLQSTGVDCPSSMGNSNSNSNSGINRDIGTDIPYSTANKWKFGLLLKLLADPVILTSVNIDYILYLLEELMKPVDKLSISDANRLARVSRSLDMSSSSSGITTTVNATTDGTLVGVGIGVDNNIDVDDDKDTGDGSAKKKRKGEKGTRSGPGSGSGSKADSPSIRTTSTSTSTRTSTSSNPNIPKPSILNKPNKPNKSNREIIDTLALVGLDGGESLPSLVENKKYMPFPVLSSDEAWDITSAAGSEACRYVASIIFFKGEKGTRSGPGSITFQQLSSIYYLLMF